MRSTKYFFLALITLSVACGGSDSSPGSSKPDAGRAKGKDAAAGSASTRDGGSSSSDDDDDVDGDGTLNGGGTDDTGSTGGGGGGGGGGNNGTADAGFPAVDAAAVPLNDAGQLQGSGSCCTAHDTPGCNNADLMVCVCEKDPTCCTTAWAKQCTFIVQQKYCQEGVRECVCGGDVGQSSCCDSNWGSTCDSVAKLKCDAVPGCF